MASREEILADFQACTGIDDVEVAICQLEESDWVLVDAVNKAIASNTGPSAPAAAAGTADMPVVVDDEPPPAAPVDMESEDVAGPPPIPLRNISTANSSEAATPAEGTPVRSGRSSISSFNPYPNQGGSSMMMDEMFGGGMASTSSGPRFRMLEFYVQHENRTFHLKVPDNEDIRTLKNLIENETGYKPCEQQLHGFHNINTSPPDRRRLSELNLPKENFIQLLTPVDKEKKENGDKSDEEKPEEITDYKLIIFDENKGKEYTLNFKPVQNVLGVKMDTMTLTGIPVSKQIWRGWPDNVNDQLTLAQLGIEAELRLFVDKAATTSRSATEPGTSRDNAIDVENSDDDLFEDASSGVVMEEDDDYYFGGGGTGGGSGNSSSVSSSRLQPLIPDDYGDEAMASIKFAEEFANRYGRPHPEFFPGTLDDAIKDSCIKPAKERKMLAIYLHHDSSVLTNVFCTQALCADAIVSYLNENFVTFGWDLTHSSNKSRALKMITDNFGSVAAATVRNLDVERLPIMALVYRLRGTTEIFQMIHGNVTLDELMSQLISAHETYDSQLVSEIREEEERAERDAVKREQDLAFEMAQHADREKEMQKKLVEEERKEQERLDEAIRQSEEEEQKRIEAEKEANRLKVAARLPQEPPTSSKEKVARVRFRAPEKQMQRRFLATDKLSVLFDYLTVEGFAVEEFKVLSSYPRRDITTLDKDITFEEAKLFPQETLTLEER